MNQDLVAQIVAQEWAMFNEVQNAGGRPVAKMIRKDLRLCAAVS